MITANGLMPLFSRAIITNAPMDEGSNADRLDLAPISFPEIPIRFPLVVGEAANIARQSAIQTSTVRVVFGGANTSSTILTLGRGLWELEIEAWFGSDWNSALAAGENGDANVIVQSPGATNIELMGFFARADSRSQVARKWMRIVLAEDSWLIQNFVRVPAAAGSSVQVVSVVASRLI